MKQVRQVSSQIERFSSVVLSLTVGNCAFNQNQLLDTWVLSTLHFSCMQEVKFKKQCILSNVK